MSDHAGAVTLWGFGVSGHTLTQRMIQSFHAHKAVAILCLAVLVLAMFAGYHNGIATAVLPPFWLFLGILIIDRVRRGPEGRSYYRSAFRPPVASRAPPVL